MSATLDDRQRLEAAVTKVGKSLDELVKVIERSKLTTADFAKAFIFLGVALRAAQQKAELATGLSQVANGFSLDAELPSEIALPVSPIIPALLHAPAASPAPASQPVSSKQHENFGMFGSPETPAPDDDDEKLLAELGEPDRPPLTVKDVGGRFVSEAKREPIAKPATPRPKRVPVVEYDDDGVGFLEE